ncbi:RloB domain-containing protein [Kushneria phyllosphaerae]|uniref:RloB domain-containing protein n=1 Tax=Kushneria phyllosphaerae TaxID=2100822 RepID=A0A2R8CHQ7_9GAMM|nr:RloB domain-containing protein [Kushneria phyllosphaerae]SPJ32409.1 hypothetical protein KSP9073_00409 [Kushneria phyllosphaerae]
MARKRPARQRQYQASQTTLLIVGEGADDQAFIKHMQKQLRSPQSSIKPKIEKQSGGSPGNIIDNAARKYAHQDFDQRFIVLDTDVLPSQQQRDKAQKHGFHLIFWSPTCLEGALLEVLGERVNDHETAQQLKARLHPRLAGQHTEKTAYAGLFPRPVLEETTQPSVVEVRSALAGQLT